MNVEEILSGLNELANAETRDFKKKKYAIEAVNSLGITQKQINELVKEIGKDSERAKLLFDTGIYEARILCGKTFRPKDLTENFMDKWVQTFENWEICDTFSMALFASAETDLVERKIRDWCKNDQEFIRRAGFATIAGYTSKNKKGENAVFESFYPLILKASTDDRNFVKKAVNWALRSIGKRNSDLLKSATQLSETLMGSDDKTANWIGKDAYKELSSPEVKLRNYPRNIYG